MKREMDLIRQVVLAAECGPPYPKPDGWTDDAIRFHQMLAIKANLLEGSYYSYVENTSEVPSVVNVTGVSWEGHDFIQAIRDDNNWTKVKNYLIEHGKAVSPETVFFAIRALFGA